MQKKQVNLAEAYPTYFATAELTQNLAELTDVEIARLDKVEAALTAKAVVPVAEAPASEEKSVVQAVAAPVAQAPVEENPQYAALLARVEGMEKQLNQKPASSATVIADDLNGEGNQGDQPKAYACSVDAELEKFFK